MAPATEYFGLIHKNGACVLSDSVTSTSSIVSQFASHCSSHLAPDRLLWCTSQLWQTPIARHATR
eukprot:6696368-Prorocentrum_lima.AAC.1